MDILSLFIGYTSVFLLGCIVYFYHDSPIFNSGPLGAIKNAVCQVFHCVFPKFLIGMFHKLVDYIFYTRNHCMQAVFGLLVLLGHVTLILDMLPVLTIFEPDVNHIGVPITFLFVNLLFYQLSCLTDPGEITRQNVDSLVKVYKADDVLYKPGTQCRTCKVTKPARSKHCSFCNRCVHRFDHHCIWTNNCVGAGNLRFFLLFLFSLIIMCINGVLMSLHTLMLVVRNLRLMETSYVDPATGNVYPVTFPVLVQHLFMQHPRVVFLAGSLVLLLLLLFAFTGYHLYLICVNQTTNERFKLSSLQLQNNNNSSEAFGLSSQQVWTFYDRGVLLNFLEVFCPLKPKGRALLFAVTKDTSHVSANGHSIHPRRDVPKPRMRRKV